ncbi:MAG: hypothetical protein NVSMB38_43940 [Ktedonobacteraceae bacterium]
MKWSYFQGAFLILNGYMYFKEWVMAFLRSVHEMFTILIRKNEEKV